MCAISVVLVGAVVIRQAWHEKILALEAESSGFEAQLDKLKNTRRAAALQARATTEVEDFVQKLPAHPDADRLMLAIERSRKSLGLAVGRIQIDPRPAEPGQLSSLDMSLNITGPYVMQKQALSDIAARIPELTVTHLSMRRNGPTADLDSNVTLRLWAQPSFPVQRIASGVAGDSGSR